GRLWPLQPEGDLVVTVRSHLLDIAVPGFARVDAKLLARLAAQQIPGAFDVLSGEGSAVMPFDALAQREGQLGPFLVRGPAGGQIGDDRLHAVLRAMMEPRFRYEGFSTRRTRRDAREVFETACTSSCSSPR